jgi:hypothetical protein
MSAASSFMSAASNFGDSHSARGRRRLQEEKKEKTGKKKA